ncbi:hypothetical protein FM107_07230 [Sphingobacterium sp. JB170]|nr:hypothetical protein FM107_07230 [Sphingobacterium sp. JB170]
METQMIRIVDFCRSHQIEINFVEKLSEYGLIALVIDKGEMYVMEEELLPLEQFTSWHYELEMNFPGIEVAQNLLSKIKTLQQEIQVLKNS